MLLSGYGERVSHSRSLDPSSLRVCRSSL
jgi:hypothetical protein